MRRRVRGDRSLSAESLVAVGRRIEAESQGASAEVVRYALHHALGAYGYNPVDLIRARRGLRQGKADTYR